MDELKIVSLLMRGIVSKVGSSLLRKRTGADITLQVNDLKVTVNDGKAHVHLDIDADLTADELIKLLKDYGLM